MLTGFLDPCFVLDLVEHLCCMSLAGEGPSKLDGPLAPAALASAIQRGLGMHQLLLNHSICFNNWIKARETSAGPVRALQLSHRKRRQGFFLTMLRVDGANVDDWHSNIRYNGTRIAG